MTENQPIDRFLIAAVTDRLIFGHDTLFDPADARTLLNALPHRKTPGWEFGISGRFPGGTTEGYAAGVGSMKVENEKGRSFSYGVGDESWTRAGQWKLKWFRKRGTQLIEIEQVMADEMEEGKGARIRYAADGTPIAMDIRIARSFGLLNIELVLPSWKPWKTPASAAT